MRRCRKQPGIGRTLGSHPGRAANKPKNKPFGFVFLAWLDRQDSNLRMLGPKPSALPLGDGPICDIFYHKKMPRRKSRVFLKKGSSCYFKNQVGVKSLTIKPQTCRYVEIFGIYRDAQTFIAKSKPKYYLDIIGYHGRKPGATIIINLGFSQT